MLAKTCGSRRLLRVRGIRTELVCGEMDYQIEDNCRIVYQKNTAVNLILVDMDFVGLPMIENLQA